MAEPLVLLAAGSLAQALSGLRGVARRPVEARFGPSGLLRAEIEAGAAWDVFASADEDHPARLAEAGRASTPRRLCRNTMALLVRPGLDGDDALALMARSELVIGVSTPGNDPSGDYAMAILRRITSRDARLGADVARRTRRLTGATVSASPPAGRNAYAYALESGAADLFLTYRTNARAAIADHGGPGTMRALALPADLTIEANYAVAARRGAPDADALVAALIAPPTQARLAALGFLPPDPALDGSKR